MTHDTKRARRLAPLPVAAIAVLLLAGCSTGHIGESWQCPLAEGGLCDSVAAADPAVPDPKAAKGTVLAEPLWRARGGESGPQVAAPPCDAECAGFDPFGWLIRLFGEGGGSAERAAPEDTMTGAAGAAAAAPSAPGNTNPGAGREDASDAAKPASLPVPPTAHLPAAPEAAPAAEDDASGHDLRTGEILARIWIAPFVDADGVYREASHVRVVLEPAGWRLP